MNRSVERAWIELEGIEAIVKTASKAKFFIEFHSSCLEGRGEGRSFQFYIAVQRQKTRLFVETRRSSENDSQGCDIPKFLKLGWSFKQLPKVRGSSVRVCVISLPVLTLFFHVYPSSCLSCLTSSIFRTSICCCPSSPAMALSPTVSLTSCIRPVYMNTG